MNLIHIYIAPEAIYAYISNTTLSLFALEKHIYHGVGKNGHARAPHPPNPLSTRGVIPSSM